MTAPDVRLITVRPPWSFAIAHLDKRVENRVRPTSYRGPVFIHTGRSRDHDALGSQVFMAALRAWGGPTAVAWFERDGAPEATRPGHVVATARLVDCHPDAGDCCGPWANRSHTVPGVGFTVVHHLVLADVAAIVEAIPARGQLGLPWRADASLAARLSPYLPEQIDRQHGVAAERAGPGDYDVDLRARVATALRRGHGADCEEPDDESPGRCVCEHADLARELEVAGRYAEPGYVEPTGADADGGMEYLP